MNVPVIVFLAAAASSTATGPGEAPVPATMTVPPIPHTQRAPPDKGPEPVSTVTMDVLANGIRLWSGPLRVQRSAAANYNQSTTEGAVPCLNEEAAPGAIYRAGFARQNLRVTLAERGSADQFFVSVNWTRSEGCGGINSRSVSLEQLVTLRAGERNRLTGDGGLAVTLARVK